jgi:DNA-directed RNA polymerase I, II, and III subunit RPABC2
LGERAKQLSAGAEPLVKINDYIIDEYSIALMELKEKKLPFIIERPLPNGTSEFWKLADLEIIL